MRTIPGDRGLAQVMLLAQNGWNKTFGHLPLWHNTCCQERPRRDRIVPFPALEENAAYRGADSRAEMVCGILRNSHKRSEAPPLCTGSRMLVRALFLGVGIAAAQSPIRPGLRPFSSRTRIAVDEREGADTSGVAALGGPSTVGQRQRGQRARQEGIAESRDRKRRSSQDKRATSRYTLLQST